MIVFDLLTGFLGSGKTTLLNAFLQLEAGQDTAIIVNEFGAIGLDQLQYKELPLLLVDCTVEQKIIFLQKQFFDFDLQNILILKMISLCANFVHYIKGF